MKCDEVIGHLVSAADLIDDGRTMDPVLAEHLVRCLRCREALENQRAVVRLMRSRPPDRPSDEFSQALRGRLDRAHHWLGIADWRVWTLRLSPAAVLLAATAFLWQLPPRTSGGSPTAAGLETTVEIASGDSVLWQFELTADSVVDAMLTSPVPRRGAR
jgi:hypothetical protein